MPDSTISDLPAASSPLGPIILEVVQGGVGGNGRRATDAQLAARLAQLIAAGDIGAEAAGALAAHVAAADPHTQYVLESLLGVASGVATLGSDGKVVSSQLPASVVGGLSYQGTWNASTNSPAIPAAASGNKGYYYKVATAGATAIDGIAEWAVGDWIVSNGATWDKVDNTEAVSSVAGLVGAISASSLRTALALVVGTDVQAFSARLAELAAISWAQGDIAYFNGTNLVRLPAGTAGHFLQTAGAAANPQWAAASAGGINVQTVTSAATVTPTFSNDLVRITAQAGALTIANPSGTAVEGWGFVIRIKDNGTARAISYGTNYRAIGVTPPTTTVPGKTVYLGCVWNDTDSKVDVLAVGQEA